MMKHSKLFSLTGLFLAALLVFTGCTATQAPPEETTASPQTRTVLETLTTEIAMGDMVIANREEYIYNEQGLLTEIVSYSGDQEVSRTTVENDEHGSPVRQTSVAGEITTVTESECTYDENGNLIKQVSTVTTNGEVTTIREYEYTPEGKVLNATFTTTGENGYTTGNSYEYDEAGRQTAEIFLSPDGSTARKETQYNEEGNPIRSVTTNSDGVVTVETDYIYLEDGTVKTVSGPSYTLATYNEQGNPLTQETYTGDVLVMRLTYTYITVPAFK